MERVAFLIEGSQERLSCLLNPESLVMRRFAGVQPRRSATGVLAGEGLTDDPLLYTGGGRTEIDLDLLFDISLAGSSTTTTDVRDLTGPLWRLAENTAQTGSHGQPSQVRIIWGKWNLLGIVIAVAERLEHFTPEGVPRRSWLRMRLLRVSEPVTQAPGAEQPLDGTSISLEALQELEIPPDSALTHEVIGGAEEGESGAGGAGERLDEIASQAYGDPALWRLIAEFNDIASPMQITAGSLLRIPTVPGLETKTASSGGGSSE
jgi:hypothetical protein